MTSVTPPFVVYQEFGLMVRNLIVVLRHTRGATAIEYGLIAALIAVAAIAAMKGLGNQLGKTFSNISTNMKAG